MDTKIKKEKRERRRKKIRAKIFGTSERPRLSIFKSNRYITLQIVNDEKGAPLAYTSTKGFKEKNKSPYSLRGFCLCISKCRTCILKMAFSCYQRGSNFVQSPEHIQNTPNVGVFCICLGCGSNRRPKSRSDEVSTRRGEAIPTSGAK